MGTGFITRRSDLGVLPRQSVDGAVAMIGAKTGRSERSDLPKTERSDRSDLPVSKTERSERSDLSKPGRSERSDLSKTGRSDRSDLPVFALIIATVH